MDPKQLRKLISRVLFECDLFSIEAVEMGMLTAAQESRCGRYIMQLGSGIALGIFQMEPETEADILNNYVAYRTKLKKLVDRYRIDTEDPSLNLLGNIPYQILLMRLHYLRVPEMLPHHKDLKEMGRYYKQYYNTPLGKATAEEAIKNYREYAL